MYLITILQCYRDLLQYLLILLHYREVSHYREFITLLKQNIIIYIFQNILCGHFEKKVSESHWAYEMDF